MSYIVTQLPSNNNTYAINQVPKCIFSSVNEDLEIKLKVNNVVKFSASYSPDLAAKVTADFHDIIADFIGTNLPQSDFSLQQDWRKTITIQVAGATSGTSTTRNFTVVNTMRSALSDMGVWLASRFLTNQPIEKHTTKDAPEWLTYYDKVADYEVWVRFYRKNGGHIDMKIRLAPSVAGCYTINVNFGKLIRIASILPSAVLGYYDIMLKDTAGEHIATQRYIYDERTGREQYFCFANACGGIDTVICQGDNILNTDPQFNIGRIGNEMRQLDDEKELRKWQQEIGCFENNDRDWLHELLTAKKGAWKYEANEYKPIVLTEASLQPGTFNELQSGSFSYMLSDAEPIIKDRINSGTWHQSEADRGGDPDKDTDMKKIRLPFINGSTETIQVQASQILVLATASNAVSASPAIKYLINGSVVGSFTPSITTPAVINMAGTQLSFITNNTTVTGLLVNYYEQEIS